MRMKHHSKIKYLCLGLALCMSLGALSPCTPVLASKLKSDSLRLATGGRWAPDEYRKYGFTYGEYVAENGEPDGATLLIGTYLIIIGSNAKENDRVAPVEPPITGEIYIAALNSRLTYKQNVAFYMSEIGGDYWYDIDTADSLYSIKPNTGTLVDDTELDNMLITQVVKNGIPYSPLPEDNQDDGDDPDKNPFLTPSPYNLDEMPELSEILAMTTDGSLGYSKFTVPVTERAENQSNRFVNERLRYMFAHDEDIGTLPMGEANIEAAVKKGKALSGSIGSNSNSRISDGLDTVEDEGILAGSLTDDSLKSLGRVLYHFSDTRDEITAPMDEGVVNLWDLYLEYKKAAKEAGEEDDDYNTPENEIDNKTKYKLVYGICAGCDATRRSQAYYNLASNEDFHGGLGPVLQMIYDMNETGRSDIGRNVEDMSYYEKVVVSVARKAVTDAVNKVLSAVRAPVSIPTAPEGSYIPNELLRTKLSTAIEEAQYKSVDYAASAFVRGESALSQRIYDKQVELTPLSTIEKADGLVLELIYLNNIKDSKVINAAEELKLISELIPAQNTILGTNLKEGVPDGYADLRAKYDAEKDKSKKEALEEELGAILNSQMNTAMDRESDMEFVINALTSRNKDKESLAPTLKGQLEWIRNMKSQLTTSDYKNYAEKVRKKYEDFIIRKMLEAGIPVDGQEGDPIISELKKLEQKAIKDNDPKLAKTIADIGQAYEKNPTNLPDGYSADVTVDPKTGTPSVNLVKDGGNKNTGDRDSGDGDNMGSGDGGDGSGSGIGDGDGSGEGDDSGLTGSLLDNLLDALGTSWDELGPDGKAELVAALNQYGREYDNEEALETARTLLDEIMDENNPFVYAKYSGTMEQEYVSLGAIDRARLYTRRRLVKEGDDLTMSSTDSGLSYIFRYGSSTVYKVDGSKEELGSKLLSQTDEYQHRGADTRFPYLYEEDSKNKLGCRAEYIIETKYAILVTTAMEPRIKHIIETLIGLYGS